MSSPKAKVTRWYMPLGPDYNSNEWLPPFYQPVLIEKGAVVQYVPGFRGYPAVEFLAQGIATQTMESHGRDCKCFLEVPESNFPAMSPLRSKPISVCLRNTKRLSDLRLSQRHQATQTRRIMEVDEIILEKEKKEKKKKRKKPVSACRAAPKGIILEKDSVKPVVEN